jgi:hypothetical protein
VKAVFTSHFLTERKKFDNYINDRFKYINKIVNGPIEIFAKYQPFPTRSKWLKHLKDLVNGSKHRALIKSVRQHHKNKSTNF